MIVSILQSIYKSIRDEFKSLVTNQTKEFVCTSYAF